MKIACINDKKTIKHQLNLTVMPGVLALVLALSSNAAATTGIDFDVASGGGAIPPSTIHTEPGFLSVPATAAKDYNITHNGITFDIKTTHANLENQNRFRGGNTDTLNNLTPITTDFIQWYGRNQPGPVEATITLTGLAANTNYELGFYMYNAGAGQTTHVFYQGASAATGTLLSTFSTAGNQNTPATWVPNVDHTLTSDSTGKIEVTIQAVEYTTAGGDTESRLTFDGMSVTSLGPQPTEDFQLTITTATPPATGYNFEWASQPGKVYDLLTSADLATPIPEWPVYDDGETLHKAIPTAGVSTSLAAVPSSDPRRFFAIREYDATPEPVTPELSSVSGSGTTITLNFTEEMEETAATTPQNYNVFNLDVFWPVTSAVLSPDGRTVTLTLGSALAIDTTYNVTISNLAGSDGTPLGGSTTVQFETSNNAPDGIKVFILAGQSNMVGFGNSETGNDGIAGAIGSLRHMAVNNTSFRQYDYTSLLVNPSDPANSPWKTRGDVKVWWRDGSSGNLRGAVRKGDLGPPFQGANADLFGPEYAFGQVLGDYYVEDDVLIIKAAWGGRSLAVDFRPPSAVAARGGEVGPFYRAILNNVREVLAGLGTEFPEWSGMGYQIVGFGWHQGWNDRVTQTFNDEYEANMENFINDVRTDLGIPGLPFVISTTGMTGWDETHPRALSLMNAQLAMANFTKYPAFAGNVAVIDTRGFWRDASVSPANQGFHWNRNGETYFMIGKSMGDNMVNLLTP